MSASAKKKKITLYPYWMTVPSLIVYSLFYIVPLLTVFLMAFTDWNAKRLWTPHFTGLSNIISFLSDKNFAAAFENTFRFAIITTIGKTVVGLLLALILVRHLKGRNFFRTLFFLPTVLNTIVIGLVFTAIFKMNGMFSNLLQQFGLIEKAIDWLSRPQYSFPIIMFVEIWQWSGLSMMIYIAGLQGIPQVYYEAAELDGATGWQKFKNVTLPLLTTSTNLCVTIALIGGFRVFAVVYVLTNGGPGFATDVLSRYSLTMMNSGLYGKAAAASLVQSCIIMLISFTLNAFFKKREVEL